MVKLWILLNVNQQFLNHHQRLKIIIFFVCSFLVGPDGGLFIAMQYYSDEWTPGPYFSGEGFRIAIHKPGSTLHNVYEQGVSLRPGLQTEIGFTRMEGTYMVN